MANIEGAGRSHGAAQTENVERTRENEAADRGKGKRAFGGLQKRRGSVERAVRSREQEAGGLKSKLDRNFKADTQAILRDMKAQRALKEKATVRQNPTSAPAKPQHAPQKPAHATATLAREIPNEAVKNEAVKNEAVKEAPPKPAHADATLARTTPPKPTRSAASSATLGRPGPPKPTRSAASSATLGRPGPPKPTRSAASSATLGRATPQERPQETPQVKPRTVFTDKRESPAAAPRTLLRTHAPAPAPAQQAPAQQAPAQQPVAAQRTILPQVAPRLHQRPIAASDFLPGGGLAPGKANADPRIGARELNEMRAEMRTPAPSRMQNMKNLGTRILNGMKAFFHVGTQTPLPVRYAGRSDAAKETVRDRIEQLEADISNRRLGIGGGEKLSDAQENEFFRLKGAIEQNFVPNSANLTPDGEFREGIFASVSANLQSIEDLFIYEL